MYARLPLQPIAKIEGNSLALGTNFDVRREGSFDWAGGAVVQQLLEVTGELHVSDLEFSVDSFLKA